MNPRPATDARHTAGLGSPAPVPAAVVGGHGGQTVAARADRLDWASLGLVILLALVLAWSLDDAQWILGRRGVTSFLPWLAPLGVAWGWLGARAGWSRWTTYLLGAVLAALVVPIVVGSVLAPDGGSIRDWFLATADSTVEAYLDVAWRGRAFTQEYGHWLLALGLLVWGTGMFVAQATFGRRRPLGALVVSGLVVVVNMSLTPHDQLLYLLLFTVAALLLLVRRHVADERLAWTRRRMGDPGWIGELYLRGGVVFTVLAIGASLVLTSTASSAPLASLWSDIDQQLIELSQGLQRYLPPGGAGTRISGVSFGPQASISGRWVTDTTPALRIRVPAGDQTRYYWRAVVYDRFDLTGWSLTENAAVDRPAGRPVLDGTGEEPPRAEGRRSVAFSVEPLAFRGATIFSPDTPLTVDRPTRLTVVGQGRYFGALESAAGSGPYEVSALVPVAGDRAPGGLTENRLRAAGRDYPAAIRFLYLSVPDGALGPEALALLSTVRALTPLDNPYDLAKTIEQYLRSPAFTYSTDVSGLPCADLSVVECFAQFRQGYCQYYASTMAILLRAAGVPARLAQGFLPGERDAGGAEIVRYSNSHAWVEVYFPGYGWVSFDPTGGGVAQLEPLPSGAPVPSAVPTPTSSGAAAAADTERDPARLRPLAGPGAGSAGGSAGATYVIVAALLGVVVGLLAFLAWRRGPRGPVSAESVYASVTRLAARFGFARRPTETVYEYADSLAELLPAARPELGTVARAKVEVSYGHRDLPPERIRALRAAQQRLRVAMLGLVFRRGRRR